MISLSTLGTTLVLGALAMAAAGSVIGFVSGAKKSVTGLRWARSLGVGFALAMIAANVVMITALLSRDFTVSYVAEVGTWQTPLHITIVSLWASLTGSILLWGGVLGVYVLGLIIGLGDRHRAYQAWTLGVLLAICVMFGLLVAGVANPFAPTEAATLQQLIAQFGATADGLPMDGPGPNPLLQNHWLMVVHPPTLYLGYVGMALPFAMSAAALLAGRLEAGWMAPLRRAFLIPWAFLTFGIMLGGWWSYAVLGWGGYWAWDPVENASFLPWLTGTAFLHSAMLMQRRTSMKTWTLILGMGTFLLTLFGTFLTRSGVFNSVHAFGSGTVGPVLLTFIFVCTMFTIVLLALREHTLHLGAKDLPAPKRRLPRADRELSTPVRAVLHGLLWAALVAPPAVAISAALYYQLPIEIPWGRPDIPGGLQPMLVIPKAAAFVWLPVLGIFLFRRLLSRDFMIVAQNATFSVFTFVVFLGTTYPILAEALRDKKVSVGEPFFDAFAFPLGVLIVWLMGLGPMLPWGQQSIVGAWKRFLAPLSGAIVVTALCWLVGGIEQTYTLIAIFVCFAALFANLGELLTPIVNRLRKGGGVAGALHLIRKGRRRWGGHIAHYGVIMCVLSVALSRGYAIEKDVMIAQGQSVSFEGYDIRFLEARQLEQPHRIRTEAAVQVSQDGRDIGTYLPATHKYLTRAEGLPSPDVRSTWTHDLYLSLMSVQDDGARISLHVKSMPGVLWIWISGLVILLGTAIAVFPESRAPAVAPTARPAPEVA